jgi:subtilisin-like proprotein convertase family protein
MRGTATAKLIGALLVAAVIAASCSSDDGPGAFEPAVDEAPSASPDGGTGAAEPPDTSQAADDERIAAADEWLRSSSGLDAAVVDSLELVGVEAVGQAAHVRYAQRFDGVSVDGAGVVVHLLASGEVQGASSSLTAAVPSGAPMSITEDAVVAIAEKAVQGTVTTVEATEIWVATGGELGPGWRVELGTTDPLGSWSVVVDGTAATVIRVERDQLGRQMTHPRLRSVATGRAVKLVAQAPSDRCELPEGPSACVFRPDPIFASGGALDDPARANEFLTPVPLLGLTDPASGRLVGEFADLDPAGAPERFDPEPDARWGNGRADRGFEAQNAYYWIDYGQRTVQRLGFTSLLNRPFPVVAVDPSTVDNAFYTSAEQQVYLGVGSNGINEGEDATGILHEYGHALLDAVNRDLLVGGDVGAYHEGFGDIYAYLVTLEFRDGDAPCLFSWTDDVCLRRLDTERRYPDDLVRQVHEDGQIMSGAVNEVLTELLAAQGIDIGDCAGSDACNDVRDRVLTMALAANYYLTPRMTMPEIAGAYLAANEAQFGDADRALIEAVFERRGLAGQTTMVDADGGLADTPGNVPDGATVGIDVDVVHTYRGDLDVVLRVVDADFVDLCEPTVLFESDADDAGEDLSGFVDLSDDDCGALVPPGPDQRWVLSVTDVLPGDEGSILGFAVVDGVDTYPAAGLPVPIADADPAGSVAIVDAGGAGGGGEGTEGIGTTGTLSARVAIDHTYHGDLSVRIGVASPDDSIVCTVPVLEPDPADSTGGLLEGGVSLDACADFYPPSPTDRWFLQVSDNAAEDTGTIVEFAIGIDDAAFEAVDLPLEVPDNDVDGVVVLLDGQSSSTGQAGGAGQGAEVGLPAIDLVITHPYIGDLSVIGVVTDGAGGELCRVVLVAPDPSDSAADLTGSASMDECGDLYPPTPDRVWSLVVADTLDGDVGTVDEAALVGPDGVRYPFTADPVSLPDADPLGVELVAAPAATSMSAEPEVVVVISHPYIGDLDVVVGAIDANGEVLCAVQLREPDPEDSAIDLVIDAPVPDCAPFLPPGPDQRWVVVVSDEFAADAGSIEGFTVFAPDGSAWGAGASVPIAIPDDDPEGITAVVDGSDPL